MNSTDWIHYILGAGLGISGLLHLLQWHKTRAGLELHRLHVRAATTLKEISDDWGSQIHKLELRVLRVEQANLTKALETLPIERRLEAVKGMVEHWAGTITDVTKERQAP